MNENPYEIFQKEFPDLSKKFNELIEVQKSLKGMDSKTKQLINLAIQTANKNPQGVKLHSMIAKSEGATREEVLCAVVLNLHHSGLSSVLGCLPAAIDGFDEEIEKKHPKKEVPVAKTNQDNKIEYQGIIIDTHPEVYKPAEDTYLLINNLDINRKDEILEIGTGTGLVAIYAAERSSKVVATDINEKAVKCAMKNTITNHRYNVELKQGSLFEPIEGRKFDLILFNTPYLPTSEEDKLEEDLNAAFDGGLDGRDTIDAFIDHVKDYLKDNGRIQIVQSSLADVDKTINKLKELGFDASVSAGEKCFFEEIVVITGKLL